MLSGLRARYKACDKIPLHSSVRWEELLMVLGLSLPKCSLLQRKNYPTYVVCADQKSRKKKRAVMSTTLKPFLAAKEWCPAFNRQL